MKYKWHTSTYEWHTYDIRVHMSDIRMTCECIRVTYVWHTSTYAWHTDDIRVYTSDIQMTCEYIRMTYGCVCHLYVLVCHPYVTRLWFYHKPFFKRYIERIKLYSCMKFELWTRIVNSRERKNVFWMRFSQTISVGLLDCHYFRLRINVK